MTNRLLCGVGVGAAVVCGWALAGGRLCIAQERAPATRPAREADAVSVYANDFEKDVGKEWSTSKTDATPRGKRRFLGQFGNGKVSLSLKRLPPHKYVRLSFELFVIRSWDGSRTSCGPDIWTVGVAGGPALLRTTFMLYSDGPHRQSYPDEFPVGAHRSFTGAAERYALGYTSGVRMDAVYKLHFSFRHSADSIRLDFSGVGLQTLGDESWGLDNVKVEVLREGRKLTAERMTALWKQLADPDPVKACRAISPLVLAGDAAAVFLAKRVSVRPLDRKRVRKLIADLDADRWQTREAATKALKEMGPAAALMLHETLKATQSAEVQLRIKQILDESDKSARGYLPRHYRALRACLLAGGRQVLTSLQTKRARAPLKKLRPVATGKDLRPWIDADPKAVTTRPIRDGVDSEPPKVREVPRRIP